MRILVPIEMSVHTGAEKLEVIMLIDGNAIAESIENEIKTTISKLYGRKPCLAVVLIGNDPASKIYVSRKTKACERAGITSIKEHLKPEITEEKLIHYIHHLNKNPDIDGILVQLPLPPHINSYNITLAISPEKDVDGFHPMNLGKLLIGEDDGFVPCTPLGIKVLLEKSQISVQGKHAVIVGRSTIVGKPMAALLIRRGPTGDATVTIANRLSPNLKETCRSADILISAVGKPNLITKDMVKDGAVVIDVGINRIDDASSPKGYHLVGDVAFDEVQNQCSYITPVPGGVGPMTIAMLLNNTLKSYMQRLTKE